MTSPHAAAFIACIAGIVVLLLSLGFHVGYFFGFRAGIRRGFGVPGEGYGVLAKQWSERDEDLAREQRGGEGEKSNG